MKRFFSFFFLWTVVFILCSCEHLPNMSDILAYQNTSCVIEATIRDESEQHVKVTLQSSQVRITLSEDPLLDGITFLSDEKSELTLLYDGVEFPLPESELLKAHKWCDLFRLSTDALWKIEKDTFGGIAVFVCTDSERNITLYIDAASFLPLKIEYGDMEIDVTSIENL